MILGFHYFLTAPKTPGEQSSVEAIAGDARAPLGFPLVGPNGFHIGTSRPTLGFSNSPDSRYPNHPTNPRERPSPQMIQLRRCACSAIAHYVVRNESVLESYDFRVDFQTAHRRAVNSLGRHLHDVGHIDSLCRDFYRHRGYFATGDYHPDHLETGGVDLGRDEDIVAYLGGFPGADHPHELAAQAIDYYRARAQKEPR